MGSRSQGPLRYLWLALAAGVLAAVCLILLAAWCEQQANGQRQGPTAYSFPAGNRLGRGQAFSAYTDRGQPVSLVYYPDQLPPGPELLAAEERWLLASGLSAHLVPTGRPTEAYVCHDWVFTGGRYTLDGNPVEEILLDNGYHEVAVPQPGDLAVYRQCNMAPVMHTGVVRSAGEGATVWVESKWAWHGRYLHPASVYCYPRAVYAFFRSARPGHLLRGLDGTGNTPPPPLRPI